MTENGLLTLSVAPSLEEELIDWFLSHDKPCFSTWSAYSVGGDQENMSLSEQVAGRQKRIMFTMHGLTTELQKSLENMAEVYPNADIQYWLQPVIKTGCLKNLFTEEM